MTVLCVRGRNAVRCLSMCTAPMAGCRRESVSACRCPVPDVELSTANLPAHANTQRIKFGTITLKSPHTCACKLANKAIPSATRDNLN